MPNYNLNYTGAQVNEGIGKAMTALQEHQSLADYRTASAQDVIDGVQNTHIGGLGNAIGMRGWNQLADPMSRGTVSSVGLTLNSENGLTTVSGTSTQANNLYFHKKVMKLYAGHKYALVSELSSSNYFISINYGGNDYTGIFTAPTDTSLAELHFNFNANVDCSCSFHPQLFDLTALFGSGNEPSSVSDFRAMFPADYYPYCSGSFADLLWTNASPTHSFVAQPLSINFSGYSKIMIVPTYNFGYACPGPATFSSPGERGHLCTGHHAMRVYSTTSSSITFEDGSIISDGGATTNNAVSIPYKIFGIR